MHIYMHSQILPRWLTNAHTANFSNQNESLSDTTCLELGLCSLLNTWCGREYFFFFPYSSLHPSSSVFSYSPSLSTISYCFFSYYSSVNLFLLFYLFFTLFSFIQSFISLSSFSPFSSCCFSISTSCCSSSLILPLSLRLLSPYLHVFFCWLIRVS